MTDQEYERHIAALLETRQNLYAARDAVTNAWMEQKAVALLAYRAGVAQEHIADAIGRSVKLVKDVIVTEAEATSSHHVWTAAEITGEVKPSHVPQTQPQRRSQPSTGMRGHRSRSRTRNS
jgi:hypothetical protein